MTDLGLMYVSRLKHAKGMSLCYNPIPPFFLEEAEGLLLDFFFCFLEVWFVNVETYGSAVQVVCHFAGGA